MIKEILIKAMTVGMLLFVSTSTAIAQTDNSYIDTERTIGTVGRIPVGKGWVQAGEIDLIALRAKTHSPDIKRMGWCNTGTGGQKTAIDWADEATRQGETALREGNLPIAETNFRQAIAISETWTNAYEGLAKVLIAQGRAAEAIQIYRKIFYDLSLRGMQSDDPNETQAYKVEVYQNPVAHGGSGGASCEDGLRYALLLNKTGQWGEAITVYNSALPDVPSGDIPKIAIQFDPATPQTVIFESATRIALGLVDNFGVEPDHNLNAMTEYQKALQLVPDSDLANYYYGFGWQRLDPKDRAKFGNAQQAKAALLKAVKMGNADVKKAAEKALRGA